jgi:hypothetical protein
MRRIIGGKRYDTGKATLVAEVSAQGARSDFAWYEEMLYRTAKGNWFTAGEGGPLSHYAVQAGQNNRRGGVAIRPLTQYEAMQWLEDAGEGDALEEYFSGELEDA